MAAATTAITSPPSGSLVTASGDPKTPTSAASTATTSALFPQSDSIQSSVTSAAAAGLRASLSPKSKLPASAATPSPLTGAAAMEDERRHREQQATRMSPNPAHQALNSLLGSSGSAMSKSTQAPKAATEMSEPLARVAKSITIPDKVTADTMHTSPTSLSSLGSVDTTTAPTVTASDTATAGPTEAAPAALHADVTTPTQANSGSAEQPSNRAFTFPGPVPIESDPRGPMRNMSLPGYGNSPKSPSNKRHKCPYCATDFTRHHNLKSHLLTHSQEKPYECPTCQARFRRLHDLKRHTKLHTGERPHTCNRCGRRFARGDALARHTKGQGGCAGRRSSFGLDEDGEGRGDTMDGLTYHGDGDDDEHMDEDMPSERRVSEPASRNRQNSTQGSFHPNSSTYPPIARMATNQPSIYSSGPSGASSQANSLQPHRERAISSSSMHFNAPPSVFAHGGMTESPKPISPGQSTDQHRLGVAHDSSLPGGRSPSLSQQIHQQQLARGAGRGTSPMSIPPPANSHAPQLPTLPGLNPSDNRAIASKGPSVQITTQSGSASSSLNQQMPAPGSNPSSVSSHGQGSGNSMRDITGSGRDENMWAYIREVEARFAQKNEDYERKIRGLEEEVVNLRSQLQHQGGNSGR